MTKADNDDSSRDRALVLLFSIRRPYLDTASTHRAQIMHVLETLKESGCTKEEILRAVEALYEEEENA